MNSPGNNPMATAKAITKIEVSKRLRKLKTLTRDMALRDIANQTAMLLYGKGYSDSPSGVLGEKGQILFKKNLLGEKDIRLVTSHVDSYPLPTTGGTPGGGTRLHSQTRGYSKIVSDIHSMMSHAQRHGILISEE